MHSRPLAQPACLIAPSVALVGGGMASDTGSQAWLHAEIGTLSMYGGSTVSSHMLPQDAAPQAAPVQQPAVAPEVYCLKSDLCPWCRLGMPLDEHGNLVRAGAKVLQAKTLALQECAGGAHQYLQHTTGGMLMMLLACSQQAELLDPSESTRNQVAALRGQGLLPTMFVPPPAPAVVGDAAASASGDGGSEQKKQEQNGTEVLV